MYTEEQLKPYIEDLNTLLPDESLIKYLEKNKNTENFDALVEHGCNVLLDGIQRLFHKYDKDFEEYKINHPAETNFVKLYLRATEYIANGKSLYYKAVSEFLKVIERKQLNY